MHSAREFRVNAAIRSTLGNTMCILSSAILLIDVYKWNIETGRSGWVRVPMK